MHAQIHRYTTTYSTNSLIKLVNSPKLYQPKVAIFHKETGLPLAEPTSVRSYSENKHTGDMSQGKFMDTVHAGMYNSTNKLCACVYTY